jgi:hypothetical protein
VTHPTGPGHPGPDPTPIGPHGPRTDARAVLAVLYAAGGYPSLCRRGIWHAVLTVCAVCDSPDGCDCAVQAAHAAQLLAHPLTVLTAPAALVAAGTTPGDAA